MDIDEALLAAVQRKVLVDSWQTVVHAAVTHGTPLVTADARQEALWRASDRTYLGRARRSVRVVGAGDPRHRDAGFRLDRLAVGWRPMQRAAGVRG